MFLTATNLHSYLMARGLISPAAVVDGDYTVAEAGRRNRNFKVLRRGGPGLFVKQIRTLDPMAIHTLQREAACYRLATASPDLAAWAELMPRFVDHDPARSVLVVDLLPEGENLTEHHQRLGGFPEEPARSLGRGLAAYHAGLDGRLDGRPEAAAFPHQPAWILDLENGGYAAIESIGPATVQLAAILRRLPELVAGMAALAREWRRDSLIHGDMKWDNCLVWSGPDSLTLRIVDWELADVGDASWDVGAIFQCYLVYLLMTTPVLPGGAPEALYAAAWQRLPEIRPALRAFWDSYAAARGFVQPARSYLERCFRFAAARLIVSVVEHSAGVPQLSLPAQAMILASLALLRDPARAAAEWMGL